MDILALAWHALIDFLIHGVTGASGWQVLAYTLVVTHITIASVTLFLHRAQAHRALDLHPAVSHFFRFWLWMTTGMVTKEWVAVHRKHHAKCETEEDPHSPQTRGIRKVLAEGAELYRTEAKNQETLSKYSHGVPDDWVEREIYTGRSRLGVSLMLILNVALFGIIGLSVWAVQMLWIPINAAGIINGIGHFWGYRNFEAPDASTNVSPWGVVIGGEELHNNHHTYPTSAKFSVKPYEFDIGWLYITVLSWFGLARARKIAPALKLGAVKAEADAKTLEAIIANRYELMAGYARELKRAGLAELRRLQAEGQQHSAQWSRLQQARRWLHRDAEHIPEALRPEVARAVADHPVLSQLHGMREEFRQLWTRSNVSAEQLVADLQAWCRKAEASGNAALQAFAIKLRAAHA